MCRLVLTSIVLSIKFNDDFYDLNSFFAFVGGVDNAELNQLELLFLEMIDGILCVSSKRKKFLKLQINCF